MKITNIEQKLLVRANMKDLPDTLDIDITNLLLGKAITAGELKYDNVQILSPKSTIICMVKMTRASTSASASAAAETAEGTEEAPEE